MNELMAWNQEYLHRKKTLIDELKKVYDGIVGRGYYPCFADLDVTACLAPAKEILSEAEKTTKIQVELLGKKLKEWDVEEESSRKKLIASLIQ